MKDLKIKHEILSAFYHGPGEKKFFSHDGNLNEEGAKMIENRNGFFIGDQIEIRVSYEEDGLEQSYSWFFSPPDALALLIDKKCWLHDDADGLRRLENNELALEFVPVVEFRHAFLGYVVTEVGDKVLKFLEEESILTWPPQDGEPFEDFRARMQLNIEKMQSYRYFYNKYLSEIRRYQQ